MSAFDDLDQAEAKSAFDELDAAEQPAPEQPKMGAGEAAGRGFVSGGTFGWNDEIVGGATVGINALAKAFGFKGAPEIQRVDRAGNPIESSLYARARDEERAKDTKAQTDQPLAYGASQVAGGLVIPGGAGGGALRTVGRIAAEGAAQGLGEADVATAESALKGAGSSLAGAGVMKGAGKLLKRTGSLAPRFARAATRKRLNAAGIDPRLKSADMGATSPEAQALRMRKMGIGKAKWGFIPASTAEINEQASAAAGRMRQGRQGLEAEFRREGVMVEPGRAGQRLRNRAKELQGPKSRERQLVRMQPAPQPAVPPQAATVPDLGATNPGKRPPKIDSGADTVPDPKGLERASTPRNLKLTPLPPMSPQGAYREVRGKRIIDPETAPMQRALKQRARYYEGMDRRVPFDQLNAERAKYGGKAKFHLDSPAAAVRQDVHKALNDELTLAAGPKGKEWRGMGQDEHAAILARDKSGERLDQQSKAGFGLRDFAAGAAGSSIGGPLGGLVGVGLNRGMNGRGMSSQAAAYEALTSGAQKSSAVGRVLDSKRAARVGSAVGRTVNNPENQETPEDAARARYIEEFTR